MAGSGVGDLRSARTRERRADALCGDGGQPGKARSRTRAAQDVPRAGSRVARQTDEARPPCHRQIFRWGLNNCSNVACALPYSVVLSLTAPDIQMVVVPAMSTNATTAIAKVSFKVLPLGKRFGNGRSGGLTTCGRLGLTCLFLDPCTKFRANPNSAQCGCDSEAVINVTAHFGCPAPAQKIAGKPLKSSSEPLFAAATRNDHVAPLQHFMAAEWCLADPAPSCLGFTLLDDFQRHGKHARQSIDPELQDGRRGRARDSRKRDA